MVKNLIFDLGGVVLDLAVSQTILGFSKLSGLPPEIVTERFRTAEGFMAFERGEISEKEFRDFVRELYNIEVSDEDIDLCWNAMLLTIPMEHLELLSRLKAQHRTFLLSNTNTIHLDYLNQNVIPAMRGVRSLDDYFHKTYYSQLIGMRKPDPAIFKFVLKENDLIAEETLFLDDNADNIEGAKSVGLQTAYVDRAGFIMDYFNGQRTT